MISPVLIDTNILIEMLRFEDSDLYEIVASFERHKLIQLCIAKSFVANQIRLSIVKLKNFYGSLS